MSLGWRGQVAEALARKGNNHFPRGRVNVVDVAIMVVPVMRTQRMLAGLVLPRLRGRVGREPAASKLAQVAWTYPLWLRFARLSPASGGEELRGE